MADLKISALTVSITPLAGTEVLPIVQSSTTKQVSVENLTAGRTVAAQSQVLGGITMPSWASPFDSVMQMKYGAITGSGTSDSRWFINSYYDGAYKYVANGYASRYDQSSGQHFWYTAANNTGGAGSACSFTQVAQLGTTGDYTLNTGNLVIGTSGKGIDFSATSSGSGTMTSELLSDYEEGTWTPTLVGTTTNPTVTYTLQRGIYTKVGRVVTVSVYMAWSAISGGSGNIGFGGLPFPVEGAVGAGSSGAVGYFDGFTLSVSRTSVGIFASPSTSYCTPTCFGSAVSTQYIPVGSVAASGTLAYQMTYFT